MDISKIASELGKLGGKKSVEKRLQGKTKEEISKIMSNVRKKICIPLNEDNLQPGEKKTNKKETN